MPRHLECRGYIASGPFKGNRVPQHVQNLVIKHYCESNNLIFVISRAEYFVESESYCQLWAALTEKFRHICFYSIWQLPSSTHMRQEVIKYCLNNNIVLHFACERLSAVTAQNFGEIEMLIKVHSSIETRNDSSYLKYLGRMN